MKDSYKPLPFKLEDLKEERANIPETDFHPLFSEVKSEKMEVEKFEEKIRRVFEEAYAEGEKAGYEMGMKKVEPVIKRLNNLIAGLEGLREEMRKKTEYLACELAVLVSEAIILKECSIDRNIIVSMVRKGLEICEKKWEITVRVRPEDVTHLSSSVPFIKVLPDETLKDPGFIIESNFGEIDGTFTTQLEEIKRVIWTCLE